MARQCLSPESLSLCPTCLRDIATDSDQPDDSVHRFVRLIACFEVLIKLLASCAHAVSVEMGPSERYLESFEASFVKKRPSLGDWYAIVESTSKHLSKAGPPWLAPIMRWLRDESQKDSAISALGRYIMRARRSLPTEGPRQPYSGATCLARIVELRNAYGHGALTPRFAERYQSLLTCALEEFVRGVCGKWQFVIPRRYDPADPKCAIVMYPETPNDQPKSIPSVPT